MTAPAIFSLVPLTETQELPLPDNGPYIVATKSGYMLHQKTHWGRVLVPTKEAPALPESTSFLWHDINLPADLIGQAWAFFRAVWETRKSEAMVDITWSRERGYRLFVPPQEASMGGVKAQRTAEHYRGQIVGTMHSHCNFNAYHSGTDTHDADGHDGLHITIGHVHEDKLDIAIMVSSQGIRWDLELDDITHDPVLRKPFPAWWLGFVKDHTPITATPSSGFGHYPSAIVSWKPPAAQQPNPPTTTKIPNPEITADDAYEILDDAMGLANAVDLIDQLETIQAELDQYGVDLDWTVQRQILTATGRPFSGAQIDPDTRAAYERWLTDD